MSVDVNNLGTYLAKLSPTQLGTYAELHKNNPYIVSMVLDESNRRKAADNAQKAQQGQVPQPKVVDKVIASIAAPMPEDQGIAQLPAGDMNFADGGIVAFADRGLVVDPYAYENPFAVMPSGARQDELRKKAAATEFVSTNPDVLRRAQFKQMNNQPLTAEENTALSQANTGAVFTPGGESGLRPVVPGQEEVKAEPAAKSKAAPTAGTGSAAAAPGFGGIAAALNKPLDVAATKSPFQSDLEAANAERVAARQAELSGIKDIQAKYADAFKGREERLTKREEALGTMKDQSLGLALLQAGAAMMTTPGGIGQAIGKGVDVGSKQYATGIERVRAAQDKLSDARDRLEELKLNRDEMSDREVLKATSAIKEQEAAGKEMLIKANMDMYKIDREEAMKRLELQTRVGIAQIESASRNRNTTLELLQAVQKDPKLAQAYQALHGTKNDLMDQYNEYIGKNPAGSIEDFLKTKALFSTLGGVSTKPVSSLPQGASVAPR